MNRLKEERKRLNLTQDDIAQSCDVVRRTVASWENDSPIPSDKLAKLDELGIDIYYVTTGKRQELVQVDENISKDHLLTLLERLHEVIQKIVGLLKKE